jgi:hypothetical protein
MTTKKQTEANRLNAKKSTGPATPEGKAASSMNRLRDGLYSSTVILPNENQSEFDQLHRRNQELFQSPDAAHQLLVDQLTVAQWKMLRAEVIEAGVLIQHGDEPADICLASYERVSRVHARLQRVWFKLFKELQALRVARPEVPKQVEKLPHKPHPEPAPQHAPATEKKWSTSAEWEKMTAQRTTRQAPRTRPTLLDASQRPAAKSDQPHLSGPNSRQIPALWRSRMHQLQSRRPAARITTSRKCC